jgi:spoIIIJ-associated protein
MTGFFSRLFGSKKKDSTNLGADSAPAAVQEILQGLIERARLELSFRIESSMNGETEEVSVELFGDDQDFLTEREGALLDAFQLFFKRALQHQLPDSRVNVNFDCNNFREESNKSLVDLAEKLKEKCLEQGRSVYLRALPPKDRKVVHQHLATDERVRSRSVGEGLYKKIKIYPAKSQSRENDQDSDLSDDNADSI